MNSRMLVYLQRLLQPTLFTFFSSGLECAMTKRRFVNDAQKGSQLGWGSGDNDCQEVKHEVTSKR